jgi:hypothetical protein
MKKMLSTRKMQPLQMTADEVFATAEFKYKDAMRQFEASRVKTRTGGLTEAPNVPRTSRRDD